MAPPQKGAGRDEGLADARGVSERGLQEDLTGRRGGMEPEDHEGVRTVRGSGREGKVQPLFKVHRTQPWKTDGDRQTQGW